ncbi:MAG: potassium-transporting ATPase subunit KdpA [Deltaproteobacteria bacterium]|nr:potassium-transporting ATPase subunit KdpA [Deltaproteobacteria bacterium]
MTANAVVQIAVYVVVLLALARPLGAYMARVYQGEAMLAARLLGPLERLVYRIAGVDPGEEMTWRAYATATVVFNVAGILVVYALQRLQASLPLDPAGLGPVSPDSAFDTAISFASNTNWQGYAGETTLAHLTQMLGLTVQNFVSAATGMAVLVALVRGFARRSTETIGSFWVDLTRSTLYVLLPLSVVGAIFLVSQGVVQTFAASTTATLVQATKDADGHAVTQQVIALGPAASQIAIKQLGTNGGGFFNVNSAHPFENPNGLTNLFEMLSLLLLPAALCYTFGKMIGDTRQGWALLAAMSAIFLPLLWLCVTREQAGSPALAALPIDSAASALSAGGNMEGKEVRFGIVNSALWATATTAASNGSVNAMHDSFTPLGGLVPLWLMQLGEIVFGGVGSGLYGMLVFAIVAVFVAGLMVGRTPEYLGKKIEAYEMKMASLVILVPPTLVLVGTAIACATEAGQKGSSNPGAHGFTEILYALSSAANNNGSAFAGLSANTPFYNTLLGICMFCARYWLIVPTLALAGSLARKKLVPASNGTLPTHTPLFVTLLVGVIVVVGALTFIPALALGPIVEHLVARRS